MSPLKAYKWSYDPTYNWWQGPLLYTRHGQDLPRGDTPEFLHCRVAIFKLRLLAFDIFIVVTMGA